MTSVSISVPRAYAPIVSTERCCSVEHAQLDCRGTEVVFALALAQSSSIVAIVAPGSASRIEYLAQRWGLKNLKMKSFSGLKYWVTEEGGEVWICKNSGGLDLIPRTKVDKLYVADAHLEPHDPCSHIDADQTTCIGVFAERGHWFYEFGRQEDVLLVRIDAEQAIKNFPDQHGEVYSHNDPRYARMMALEDVRVSDIPFVQFSRKRLKVRTDKPSQFLSQEQQQEARRQLGEAWESGLVGSPIVSFVPSVLQKKYLAKKRLTVSEGRRPWFLLLKYRRGGFTTIEQGQSYKLCVSAPNSHVATIAHTAASTQRISKISHLYHERDPLAPPRVDDSSLSMQFSNGSFFYQGTAGGRGFARGDTLQRVHGSEVSKWCIGPNQASKVEDLLAGIIGAASNGEVVLETTPNGYEAFHSMYREASSPASKSPFTPVFVRWFDDPTNRLAASRYNQEEIIETLSPKEEELVTLHGLSTAQIAFRREAKATYGRLFPQEFPEDDVSCFLTSGMCFFDQEICLNQIEDLEGSTEPRHEKMGPGVVTVWEEFNPELRYVAGTDTSEGLSAPCDPNGTVILRRDTGQVVARLYGRYKPRDLALRSLGLLDRYGWPLWAIERNNHGHAVLETVREHGPDVYKFSHDAGGRLYHHNGDRAGWNTDSQSRPLLLDDLEEFVREHPEVFLDTDLLRECCTFVQHSTGKFAAAQGAHDDLIMMYGIALQMRKIRDQKPDIFFA